MNPQEKEHELITIFECCGRAKYVEREEKSKIQLHSLLFFNQKFIENQCELTWLVDSDENATEQDDQLSGNFYQK